MKKPLSLVLYTLALATAAPAQLGDDCATAVPLAGAMAATTVGYTASSPAWSPWFPPSADRWFTYTPAQTGSFRVRACNTAQAVDTVAAIYTGSCGQLSYVAGDDDSCGHLGVGAEIETVLNGGVTYYLRVGTYGAAGSFTVSVGPGAGSLVATAAGGCGSVDLEFSGSLSISGQLSIATTNAAGTALVGAGLTPLAQPFCACTVGHDWLVLGGGGALQIWIPPNPALVGFAFYAQGADLVSLGTCPASGLSLSTTYRATVGI